MRRAFLFSILLSLLSVTAFAQSLVITGSARETKSDHPVEFATVALLRPDSTALLSTVTDEQGRFVLRPKTYGDYIVKASYAGFSPASVSVKIAAPVDTVDVGTLLMTSDDNMLGVATVSVAAARVEQKEDTTMYNAAAYRVAEGSTLEALVKQLPGVEVDDNGGIKWNGKTVTEFLINGKDFFKGDTETAMKNLPTELVSKIKAYDKKSDYAEQTGIDDGEETTVLDITTKRELNESWIANLDISYGSEKRYMDRLFVSRFTDRSRVSAFGAANNTNNRGFGGPHGFRGNANGDVATYMGGLSFQWQNDKKKTDPHRLELNGNIRYRLSNADIETTSNSENFLTSGAGSSFSNSRNDNFKKSQSLHTNFRLEWKPDTMTTLIFRPSYSFSKNNNDGLSETATFNANPYDYSVSPLDSIMLQNAKESNPLLYGIMVNTNRRLSLGESHSHSVNGNLNFIRKLSSNGRNVSLRLRGGYTDSESESFSISKINYNEASGRSGDFLNQYSFTPSTNYNFNVRLGYVEPLAKNWFAEVRYQFNYKYQDSDRSRFNLDGLADDEWRNEPWYEDLKQYGDSENYPVIGSLPTLDEVLNKVRDLNNSQYATYKYFNHTAMAGVRYNSAKIRFNAGVDFNPEKTRMDYTKGALHVDTVRKVFNVSPTIRFRYKISKTDQIDVRYRGYSSEPSMTDLLAVVDDSNPLAISMGNPGLKPSWNNTLRINYNAYNATYQRGLMFGVNATHTRNSISNRVVYDETTGVRYSRPENINGNWNGRGMFMINSALGKKKLFNISSFTSLGYENAVGYVSRMQSDVPSSAAVRYRYLAAPAATGTSPDRTYDDYHNIFNTAVSEKNTTGTLSVNEDVNASYRNSWFDVGVLGRFGYQHARATVQTNANMDTWNFAYGANANFNFDFGLSVSTDIRMSSRRGYSESTMNTDELLWNAQIAQSFLKNRVATVSIQFYDILRQQSSISRVLTATSRTDSWTNSVNSYFLVHFIYKFNSLAGKDKGGKKSGERPGPPDMRGRGGMPMHMPMGRPGGHAHF